MSDAPSLFAENWSAVFGALHGLLALIMLLAFVMGAIFLFAVSQHNWKHIQVATAVAATVYLVTFASGLLLLPRYTVNVRARFLEAQAPNSVGLFEIKEHLSALGVFIALALLVLILFGRMRRASTWRKQLFAALFCILALVALIVSTLAYILAARRG